MSDCENCQNKSDDGVGVKTYWWAAYDPCILHGR